MNRHVCVVAPAFVLLASLGCGAGGRGPDDASMAALRDYPGTLHPARDLHPDFAVRQTVRIVYRDKKGEFDAVLQKNGDSLLVVGTGPMNVRTFQLEQKGETVSFEQHFGPSLPFPPRNILVDIHRAYFMKVDAPDGGAAGTVEGDRDGEHITERWEAGNLQERAFTRAGYTGSVRVTYTGPCSRAFCKASKIVLKNEWFGYELSIESEDYSALP